MKSRFLILFFISSAGFAQTVQDDFPVPVGEKSDQFLQVDAPKVSGIQEIESILVKLKANPEYDYLLLEKDNRARLRNRIESMDEFDSIGLLHLVTYLRSSSLVERIFAVFALTRELDMDLNELISFSRYDWELSAESYQRLLRTLPLRVSNKIILDTRDAEPSEFFPSGGRPGRMTDGAIQ